MFITNSDKLLTRPGSRKSDYADRVLPEQEKLLYRVIVKQIALNKNLQAKNVFILPEPFQRRVLMPDCPQSIF